MAWNKVAVGWVVHFPCWCGVWLSWLGFLPVEQPSNCLTFFFSQQLWTILKAIWVCLVTFLHTSLPLGFDEVHSYSTLTSLQRTVTLLLFTGLAMAATVWAPSTFVLSDMFRIWTGTRVVSPLLGDRYHRVPRYSMPGWTLWMGSGDGWNVQVSQPHNVAESLPYGALHTSG